MCEYFDADKVGAPIWLRCWQPGDRFQPIGTGSARKLQDLFTNLKVPRAERQRRVVAATRQGELFWVEGLRMAEKFKLDRRHGAAAEMELATRVMAGIVIVANVGRRMIAWRKE